ncbi:MAG: phosphodiester glycosidase family protein [Mycobacteriaceae bacterium]
MPGTKQKGTWAWGSGIPVAERPGLIAAFNGGFKFKDIPGGYQTEGRTPVTLADGQASLVLHAHGPAEIGAWGSEVKMTPDVTTVRQNLQLIVDHGQPRPGLETASTTDWGSHRWQLQYTNRSGLGITAGHALVYVSGSNLTTETLAKALAKLGSVRAMELDIHASNPTFNFFDPAPSGNPVTGSRLTASMKSSETRFLAPDQRDFFAVTLTGAVPR